MRSRMEQTGRRVSDANIANGAPSAEVARNVEFEGFGARSEAQRLGQMGAGEATLRMKHGDGARDRFITEHLSNRTRKKAF